MNSKIRMITILICLSAVGIVIFQADWLYNSYQISKDKVKSDLRGTLDYAIDKLKKEKADSARLYLEKYRIENPFNGGDNQQKKLLDTTMARYFNPYTDTAALNRIVKDNFKWRGFNFSGRVNYYDDGFFKFYRRFNQVHGMRPEPPELLPYKSILTNWSNKTFSSERLNVHEILLNEAGDSVYLIRPITEDFSNVSMPDMPALVLAVKVPTLFILRHMLTSIIGSVIVLSFLACCIVFLFRLIRDQEKLVALKNDFVGNISHELKTPIATTLAAVQGMQHFGVLKDEQKTQQYLNTASAELNRLAVMVNKILNISIFESAAFTVNPVIFNLRTMMEEIIASQELKQMKPVEILLNYSAEEEILADRQHVQNVIINLVDNAIKYSGPAVKIDIECKNAPGGIEMNITDNGPGIDKEYQKSIFEKFFRVPSPGDHSIKGHGLGLHYVKNIVEKHKGSVSLHSSTSGSTFTIYLPYGSAT